MQPQSKSGSGLFHGWYIVGVAFLGSFIHSEAISSTLSIFVITMTEGLGWSRGMISAARSFEQILEALAAPLVGPIVDKYGARVLMVVGALVAGTGFVLLAVIQNLWQFYLLRAIVTLGVLGFGGLVTAVAIANWFVRKRGRAFAFAGMGGSLGTIIVIPFAAWTIATLGWRETWVLFGVFVWVLVVVPSFLFMRRRPEDMGLLPDGDPAGGLEAVDAAAYAEEPGGERRTTQESSEEDVLWTRTEALHTRAFWVIVVVSGFGRLVSQGINLHLIPYLQDLGFAVGIAASVLVVRSAVGLLAHPLWGFAAERYDVRRLSFLQYALQTGAVGTIVLAQDLWMVYLGFALYGIVQGGMSLHEIMFANYYGRFSLGAVRGIAAPFQVAFSAGGPVLLGFSFDATGSYTFAFTIIVGASVICAALILLATKPRKRVPAPAVA